MNRKPIGLTTPYRKADKPEMPPPHECKTDAEKIAYAFGWFKALELNPPQINAKLEAMAVECERMPFGDTGASFAAWIRGHKV